MAPKPTLEQMSRDDQEARQIRVLVLVIEGLSNKEIAVRVGTSLPMIKTIMQRLFHRLGVRTRAQLVSIAFQGRQSDGR